MAQMEIFIRVSELRNDAAVGKYMDTLPVAVAEHFVKVIEEVTPIIEKQCPGAKPPHPGTGRLVTERQ